MTERPEIRTASAEEFATAVDWAAAEGWNPGLDDLAAFHAADPGGFLMRFDGDEPVSSISVVRYGDDFGFLGFYIVRPDWRGRGIGHVHSERRSGVLRPRCQGALPQSRQSQSEKSSRDELHCLVPCLNNLQIDYPRLRRRSPRQYPNAVIFK
jgi:GNAT superfamily N-acetyltransferase